MHACLAQLSNELQTMDWIIRASSIPRASTHKNINLPTELLLLIRENLIPIITNNIYIRSISALSTYEMSLRDLLCPDCLAYNEEIYGPDIWQWDQFSGPCACTDDEERVQSQRWKDGVVPNPKVFTNSQHWLESHLSTQAEGLRGGSRQNPESDSPLIWEIVAVVLQKYGCALHGDDIHPVGGPIMTGRVGSRGLSSRTRDSTVVHISPLSSRLRQLELEDIGEGEKDGETYRANVIFHRAKRDLGLSLEYMEVFDLRKPAVASSPQRATSPRGICRDGRGTSSKRAVSALYRSAGMVELSISALHVFTAIIASVLALPVTFVTFTLTMLCYYLRPVSLRIL